MPVDAPRITARGHRTRAALMAAVSDLVAEVGYQHTTTRAIADRAGVSEGTIYRHFPDKRALFLAAMIDRHRDLAEWMDTLPGRAGRGRMENTLTDALYRLSALRQEILPLEIALAAEPQLRTAIPDEDLPLAVAMVGGPPARLAEYLRAEQTRGRVREGVNPTHAALTLLAALFGLQASPLAPPDGLSRADIGRVVGYFVRGLAT